MTSKGYGMGKLLSREQAIRMYNRLEREVEQDSDDILHRDLNDARRLEEEDWHTSDIARARLVERAERLGWDVADGTPFERYYDLID